MLATAESRNQAVSKLESLIERGRSRAANVIDHVMRHQPPGRLVTGEGGDDQVTVRRNAIWNRLGKRLISAGHYESAVKSLAYVCSLNPHWVST